MLKRENKHTVLILGASGFLGNSIYKELRAYFKTFGTYNLTNPVLEKNKHFFQYDIKEDDIFEILEAIKPTIIISCIRGNFSKQVLTHQHLSGYVLKHKVKIIFISSANVFDAYIKYPSYEMDKTYSNSIYGHFKIKIENMLMRLPKKQVVILRLPMVFGAQSPRIQEIIKLTQEGEPIEIFPNLIMNVTTHEKVTQQIHYIINRNKCGIFHLGSNDLVHHEDFIKEIIGTLSLKQSPRYKRVYTTNNDRYLAVLPKYNNLPTHLQIKSDDILTNLKYN